MFAFHGKFLIRIDATVTTVHAIVESQPQQSGNQPLFLTTTKRRF
jgi:hypothetical protein